MAISPGNDLILVRTSKDIHIDIRGLVLIRTLHMTNGNTTLTYSRRQYKVSVTHRLLTVPYF